MNFHNSYQFIPGHTLAVAHVHEDAEVLDHEVDSISVKDSVQSEDQLEIVQDGTTITEIQGTSEAGEWKDSTEIGQEDALQEEDSTEASLVARNVRHVEMDLQIEEKMTAATTERKERKDVGLKMTALESPI